MADIHQEPVRQLFSVAGVRRNRISVRVQFNRGRFVFTPVSALECM